MVSRSVSESLEACTAVLSGAAVAVLMGKGGFPTDRSVLGSTCGNVGEVEETPVQWWILIDQLENLLFP
jgi:hypothetical protein